MLKYVCYRTKTYSNSVSCKHKLMTLFMFLIVACPSGTYGAGGYCIPCPVGTYQPVEGEKQCTKCPDGKTTAVHGTELKRDCKGNLLPFLKNNNMIDICIIDLV